MSEDENHSLDISSQEVSEDIKKKLDDLTEILSSFSKILDYNELDVAGFLNIRKTQTYYIFAGLKIFFLTLSIITALINFFLISIISESLRIFYFLGLTIISYCFLGIGNHYDKLSLKKFCFTYSYYHKEKKDMKILRNQITLLFKNEYVLDYIGKKAYDDLYKHRIQNLEERVESYSKLIQPYFYQIKQYGLLGTFFSLIIGFFLNLIVRYFSNPTAMEFIISELIQYSIIFFFIIIVIYLGIKQSKDKSIYKEKKYLVLKKVFLTILIKQTVSEIFEKEFKDEEITILKNWEEYKKTLNELTREEKEQNKELRKQYKELKKTINESGDTIDNNQLNKLQEKLASMKNELDQQKIGLKFLKNELKNLKKF